MKYRNLIYLLMIILISFYIEITNVEAKDVKYIGNLTKEEYNSLKLPSTFDLRNIDGKKYNSALKDQGTKGYCWSYAATSSFKI